ncbi:MAG TPA: hypothetical protein PLR06_03155 [Cyclobacteriaceae bacterium]|nr:hypothetical protein [Cyclobacteriaceae bacterium]
MERPVIYVKRITNLSDARYCAGMGADMLGFVASKGHEDFVSPALFKEIMGWVSGPSSVIELTELPQEGIEDIISNYSPDLIHLSGKAASIRSLPDFQLIVEPEVPFAGTALKEHANIKFVVAEPPAVEQMKQEVNHQTGMLISVGADEDSALIMLRRNGAAGITLQGSKELKPGLKDYDNLSSVLEALDI